MYPQQTMYYTGAPPMYMHSQQPYFTQPIYTPQPPPMAPQGGYPGAQPALFVPQQTLSPQPGVVYVHGQAGSSIPAIIPRRTATRDEDVEDACCVGASAGIGALFCCLAMQAAGEPSKDSRR